MKKYFFAVFIINFMVISGCNTGHVETSFSLNTSGGNGGVGGLGGNGGDIGIDVYGGEQFSILKDGVVEEEYPNISLVPDLGANPYYVNMDINVIAVSDSEPPQNTAYYLRDNNSCNVYISNGNSVVGDEAPVTGISIRSGTIFTLELNLNNTTDVIYDTACISLANGLVNNGIIRPVDIDTRRKGNIRIRAESLSGIGSVVSAGGNDGQIGGDIDISIDTSIITYGSFLAAGGNGLARSAGHGGAVSISALEHIDISGTIITTGGVSENLNGGNGGDVLVQNTNGYLVLKGVISSSGGNGFSGGMAGNIQFRVLYAGNLIQRASIDAIGGIGTNSYAGSGGEVEISLHSGGIIWNAKTKTIGGDANLAGFSSGQGGSVKFSINGSYNDDYAVAGDAKFSGDFLLNGGNTSAAGSASGGEGGEGGDFTLELESGSNRTNQKIQFIGYTFYSTFGGDGNIGGNAGDINLWMSEGWNETENNLVIPDLISEADFISYGGNGKAKGGNGAYIEVFGEVLDLQGDMDVSGGDAAIEISGSVGGDGGYIDISNYSEDLDVVLFDITAVHVGGGKGETLGDVGVFMVNYECVSGSCD